MKQIKLFVMALACMVALASCSDDEKVITPDQLPEAAKAYIEKTYPDKSIIYVKKDADVFETTYEVAFDDGMKIEFDDDGEITDIDLYDD
ncbi:MAG: PepSY-like domain-containing protein [Bacteroidaceae bacterium]|nr:PepSY-like domain-containing protein [Bacteroidaceae bacterium]MDO4993917.1 PepSY-like domain-containing protein [Bacteroidales bacterium]